MPPAPNAFLDAAHRLTVGVLILAALGTAALTFSGGVSLFVVRPRVRRAEAEAAAAAAAGGAGGVSSGNGEPASPQMR